MQLDLAGALPEQRPALLGRAGRATVRGSAPQLVERQVGDHRALDAAIHDGLPRERSDENVTYAAAGLVVEKDEPQ